MDADGPRPRKIGALGIRVERGVAYHGIALNVDVALADFELIDPCGMPGLVVDLDRRGAGAPRRAPSTERVAEAAARVRGVPSRATLGDARLDGALPPAADAASGRAALDRLLAAPAA